MKKTSVLFFFFLACALSLAGEVLGQGRIYFSMNHSGNWDLWSIRPDGTDLKQLTRTAEDEHSPAVSPDGKEILFVDGQRTLWIMNVDGSDRREIPLPKGIYAQPSWSPDGQEI
ncbi:MAG: TolB family protein, partial [Candidatus Norongarragalinales archaeon]